MTYIKSIVTFCIAIVAIVAPMLGNAEEYVLTPSKGISVSNDKYVLKLDPVIVTQDFDGQKTISSSTVILVFPYRLTDHEGQPVSPVYNIVHPDFLDKNGNDMPLPTSSSWSKTSKEAFLTETSKFKEDV